jgi:ribonuclease HII
MAVQTPTLKLERRLWRDGAERIVGVDEVGVAPTCGAVVAAAVIVKPTTRRIPGVRDSKTLSAQQRERLAPLIRSKAIAVAVGAASVREIDQLNIYHATHLAMQRAIRKLGGHDHVLVDGNRIAGFESKVGPYTAVVDGDARVYSIACASVVAKVVRDRMMSLLSARYPGYGWERNQGYATREHRVAIRRLGLTPFHRRSFLALQRTLAGDQLSLDLLGQQLDGMVGLDELDDLEALAVGGGDHVAGLDAAGGRRAALGHALDEDAGVDAEAVEPGEVGRQLARRHPEERVLDGAGGDELLDDALGRCHRNREAERDGALLRWDVRHVDADQTALGVDERAAGVAG